MKTDNYFYIKVPYWGAYVKYNWTKNDWGLGLDCSRIDQLAKENATVVVRYGKWKQEYTISAKKVKGYPIERIKDYDKWVYIVPKSILNYRKPKSEEEELKELVESGVCG